MDLKKMFLEQKRKRQEGKGTVETENKPEIKVGKYLEVDNPKIKNDSGCLLFKVRELRKEKGFAESRIDLTDCTAVDRSTFAFVCDFDTNRSKDKKFFKLPMYMSFDFKTSKILSRYEIKLKQDNEEFMRYVRENVHAAEFVFDKEGQDELERTESEDL